MSFTPLLTNSGRPRVTKDWGKDADSFICMAPSGTTLNPLDLQAEDIKVHDIAFHLSNQNRFSGGTRYSVAEHSVRVARWVHDRGGSPEDEQWALLHDAPEYVLMDMARPLKADPYFGRAYRAAEKRAMAVICDKFGLDTREPPIVKDGDVALFTQERRDLMPKSDLWDLWAAPPELDVPQEKLIPWQAARAEKEFLKYFVKLFGKGAL